MDAKDKHTPEPWNVEYTPRGTLLDAIKAESGECVALSSHERNQAGREANARRIVAAVNACTGISTSALESGAVRELVETLEEIRDGYYNGKIGGALSDCAMADIAKAVLARIEGRE